MNTIISCPGCQDSLNVPDTMGGRKVKCPKCGTIFIAPGGDDSTPLRSNPSPASEQPRSTPAPPPRSNPFDDIDEPEERPRRRRRRRYDDDDDDYGRGPRYSGDGGGGAPLVLGILSIVFCCVPLVSFVLGLLAVCIPPPPGGSTSGRTCGIIGMVLSGMLLVLSCLIVIGGKMH
jgi:hypothetical protein